MQEILILRVGAIQILDEAHELYPGKPRQCPFYRSPVLCHDSSPFQFLHGIFSSDIVRKVKSSGQCAGNGPKRILATIERVVITRTFERLVVDMAGLNKGFMAAFTS